MSHDVATDVRSVGVSSGGGSSIRGLSEVVERRDRVVVCVQWHNSDDDQIYPSPLVLEKTSEDSGKGIHESEAELLVAFYHLWK